MGIQDQMREIYWTMYITEVLDKVRVLVGIIGTRNGNA
jgi:hypothetical protein